MKVVSENSEAELAAKAAQAEVRFRLCELTANLLRVVAGAGKPETLLTDIDAARTAYVEYIQAAKAAGQNPYYDNSLESGLRLDNLFPDHEEREPQTEEEWRRWAARDEESIDREERYRWRQQIILQIRRAVLREVAAELAGIDMHARREYDNLNKAIGGLERLKSELLYDPKDTIDVVLRRNRQRERAERAEREIAKLRQVVDDKRVANLAEHQLRALRAVAEQSDILAQTDNFTLDVLASMELLNRRKGIKGKAAWELTDEGRAAIERHEQKSKATP